MRYAAALVIATFCFALAMVYHSEAVNADRTDFKVNDDRAAAEQNHPRIAVSGDGSFAIIWSDMRNGQSDIYLQRYDSDWNAEGSNRIINDDSNLAHQSQPAIATDISGRYSSIWTDYRNGNFPFDPDEYLQRFDSALTPLGSNKNLSALAPNSLKESPDIALSTFGEGVAVWADYRNNRWDVYGQRFSSSGALIGGNFVVNDGAQGQQHSPRVSISPDGWFVVTWYGSRNNNDDIWTQMFDSVANPIGSNQMVNSDGIGNRQAFPDVAADGAGHYTVVWIDWRNGEGSSNPDIYARRYGIDLQPQTVDTKVSRESIPLAQRQPTISADKKGNVAIIWADSVGGSWDIRGQMIDVEGMIRETNFQANNFADSAQVQPDVALDGRYRYITWTDKRNGNFDIYASITKYNEPRLIPKPASLQFTMQVGGTLPPSQSLFIDHGGFNPLNYQIVSNVSWLSLSASAGITPDTIQVSMISDTLSLGTYQGTLTLIDIVDADSSIVVPVSLLVSAPTIAISPDTMTFYAIAGQNDSLRQVITIANSGIGQFSWTASSDTAIVTIDKNSGFSDEQIKVSVSALKLIVGNYTSIVTILSPDAVGSPDSVVVNIIVSDNLPFILLEPESLFIVTSRPESVSSSLIIRNGGAGSLNWSALSPALWLNLDRVSGIDDDKIIITLDSSLLSPGLYTTVIDIIDSSSLNISRQFFFSLEVLQSSVDSVLFGSTSVMPLTSSSISIKMILANDLSSMVIPLAVDTGLIVLDSMLPGFDLPSYVDVQLLSGGFPGNYLVSVTTNSADSVLISGSYELGELYFTSGTFDTLVTLEATYTDTLRPNLIPGSGQQVTPVVLPGEIIIATPTAVDDDDNLSSLPTDFVLHQNYPNPFNPVTTIEFELPTGSDISIELFNILGQKIDILVDGFYPAGRHSVVWDAGSAASGVYFYRIRNMQESIVLKMLLLR